MPKVGKHFGYSKSGKQPKKYAAKTGVKMTSKEVMALNTKRQRFVDI